MMHTNDFEGFKEKAHCTDIDFQIFNSEEGVKYSYWGVINEINNAIDFSFEDGTLWHSAVQNSLSKQPATPRLVDEEQESQRDNDNTHTATLAPSSNASFNSRFAFLGYGERA